MILTMLTMSYSFDEQEFLGSAPMVFNGDVLQSDLFLHQWQQWVELNRFHKELSAYQRVAFFLTYFKGNKVQYWIKHSSNGFKMRWQAATTAIMMSIFTTRS